MLKASLVLHQVKEVGTVTKKEINSECKTLKYISLVLTILGPVMVKILHYRKSKFCRGCTFSNAVKIMIFNSAVENYVPIKLCKIAGSIHLFKITDMLKPENIKLYTNYLWDMLEIDWKEVMVTFNGNKVSLPRVVMIKLPRQNQNWMLDEERNFTLPPNAQTRNYVAHFGHRHTRDCINNTTKTLNLK